MPIYEAWNDFLFGKLCCACLYVSISFCISLVNIYDPKRRGVEIIAFLPTVSSIRMQEKASISNADLQGRQS